MAAIPIWKYFVDIVKDCLVVNAMDGSVAPTTGKQLDVIGAEAAKKFYASTRCVRRTMIFPRQPVMESG